MSTEMWPGGIPGKGQTEAEFQLWIWTTTLTPAVLAMSRVLPRRISLDELRDNPTWADRTQLVEALHRTRTHIRTMIDIPEHIRAVAVEAVGKTITAYALIRHVHDHPELAWAIDAAWTALAEAQDHTRAVCGYYNVQPEEMGAPDTLAELEF